MDTLEELTKFFKSISTEEIYRDLSFLDSNDYKQIRAEDLLNIIESAKEENINFHTHVKDYVDGIKDDNDQLLAFRYNISNIIEQAESLVNNSEPQELRKFKFAKISELRPMIVYIERLRLKNITENLDSLIKNQKDINETHENMKENLNQAYIILSNTEKGMRDILPQAIMALGIFTTFIVLLFGGINIIDSLKILYGDVKPYEIFLFTLFVLAHILFNYLFLFFYLLSRIANTSINVRCSKFYDVSGYYHDSEHKLNYKSIIANEEKYKIQLEEINLNLRKLKNDRMICKNCAKCNVPNYHQIYKNETNYLPNLSEKEECGYIERFLNKYPYLFFANMIFFSLEIIIGIWCLLTKIM